jgi:hypothetical protein
MTEDSTAEEVEELFFSLTKKHHLEAFFGESD